MPKQLTLDLTPAQRQEFVDCRDHHRLPYLRERAAVLLLLADGQMPTRIASSRLLRPRDPDTVSAWLKRYQQEGLVDLSILPGRGRKPAYFPAYPPEVDAHEAIVFVVKLDPRQFGVDRTRCTFPQRNEKTRSRRRISERPSA